MRQNTNREHYVIPNALKFRHVASPVQSIGNATPSTNVNHDRR